MLIPRIITAVALLAILLPALFAVSPDPFAAITLLLIIAACWEWGRLNQMNSMPALGVGIVVGLGLAWGWWGLASPASVDPTWERTGWLLVSMGWVLGSALLMRLGVDAWAPIAPAFRLVLGWLFLAATWWAMARARALGINFLLSLMVLVWVADVAAYFGGRAWGKRKLAVAISPGKTWAGAWSGVAAVLVLGIAWHRFDLTGRADGPSIFTTLWERNALIAVIGVLFLVTMAVVGDLMESLVKRSAGVKDSSGLLPGHGGVLDRVDALLPVLPIGMMLVTV